MRLRHLLLISTALVPFAGVPAYAGPDGAQVVGGSAAVSGAGSANVTVNQYSDKAIINWRMFDIGVGEKTTFNQPNSNSIALNRVTGGMGPSQILGSLNANGKVFVVNRDGIIFGAGAVINTAGFLATTSDIKNEDFMAGRFNFQIPGRPDASIVNMGTITATSGGFAALVAPGVRNSGTITASLGTVALGAGNLFTLDFYGDKLITLGVGDQIAGQVKDVATGQTLSSLVKNEGALRASGGRVELTAAAARHVVDSVINTTGLIEANSVGMRNGQIVLSAATADTKGDAPAQKVRISGALSAAGTAKGTKGGKIVVTGEQIEVAGAAIDASGRSGGGTVMIGGDWGGGKPNKTLVTNQSAVLDGKAVPTASTVSVDSATTIDASARDNGNGGKVILWSDQKTSFAGTILALGGKEFGNGGFVETSSHGVLEFTGNVDTSAPKGSAGTLLLDPADTYIDASFVTPPFGATELVASNIVSQLNSGNVIISTDNSTSPGGQFGDIFVRGQISWNTNNSLTLNAFRNIQINDTGANGTIKNTAGGSLVLRADSTGTGTGTIVMNPSTVSDRVDWVSSTGKVSVYYNPANYTSPTDFTTGNGHIVTNGGVPGQLTAYMLVNTTGNLSSIGTNLSGNYALGRDINASGPVFTTLGTFTGIFDGSGGLGTNRTISNLTVAPVNPVNFGIGVGLFSAVGFGGTVKNLNFDHASITANPNVTGPGQFVGVLAGTNAGTVSNVTITNSTVSNGTASKGVIAGGLVGQNGDVGLNQPGTITNSHAAVAVTVGSSNTGTQNNNAGGLVGSNPGTITNSDASGNVTGGNNSFIGGLVGSNDNIISGSSATGAVTSTGTGGSSAGGLVAFNHTGAQITSSSASGNVAGLNAGGLVGFNEGSIASSNASGNVSGSGTSGNNNATVGGLVGQNDNGGQITNSGATGAVSSTGFASVGGLIGNNNANLSNLSASNPVTVSGTNVAAGGLIGNNNSGATITNSRASGAVTSTATNNSAIGGLVGFNNGTIAGTAEPAANQSCTSGQSCATGAVSAVAGSAAGGLVGFNPGTITNSFASSAVTAGDSSSSIFASSTYGGLVGSSTGAIDHSHATGNVTGTFGTNSIANVALGGLIGFSSANVTSSFATGNVSGTFHGGYTNTTYIGGLIGQQNGASVSNSFAGGAVSSSFDSSATFVSNNIGGLIGQSTANVSDSHATGAVTLTNDNFGSGGGLIGSQSGGTVANSYATGNVTIGGDAANTFGGSFGGLIGMMSGAAITGSHATGDVKWTLASSTGLYLDGSLGGLVGSATSGSIANSYATGNVTAPSSTVSSFMAVGGLVGTSEGTPIDSSHASGNVNGGTTGGTDVNGVFTFNSTGGLVGASLLGAITNSYATGNVTAWGETGGLVGINYGNIGSSYATGNVTGLGHSTTFTYSYTDPITNKPASFSYDYTPSVGGLVGMHGFGTISDSHATGAVTGRGFVGGLVGSNQDTITNSYATGAVTESAPNNDAFSSALGGLVGFSNGSITNSNASGAVTSLNGAYVGGFIGVNFGSVQSSKATGAVSGGSDNYLGGFVGINASTIQDSTANGNVTGTGAHNIAGGFAGLNFGIIDPSTSSGNVTSGSNSIVGGFIGANGALEFPAGTQFVGTSDAASGGTGQASGGSGSTVGQQIGQQFPTTGLPALPSSCGGGVSFCGGTLFNPNPVVPTPPAPTPTPQPIPTPAPIPTPTPQPEPQPQNQINIPQTSPLLNVTATLVNDVLADKKQDDVINTNQTSGTPGSSGGASGNSKGGNQGGSQNAGNAGRPAIGHVPAVGLGPLPSGMPPLNETHFRTDEVVMQLGAILTQEQIELFQRRYGLDIIARENFGLLGRTVYRFRITSGLPVRTVIAGVQSFGATVSAQPSYDFFLTQAAAAPAAPSQGDSAQYVVAKLGLVEAHGISTGKGVKIAVIDSEIDAQHPDLKGVIAGNYDALPSSDQTPHAHGTGMAGAIGSHTRLLGIAPGATILGIRAFGVSDTGAQGTSMNIVKGLEWAVAQGAQIINMSFAGPRDPILEQAISALRAKGIILIAAAGNAGPKSPPLFPGADPNVIAVSATDESDQTYKGANRGKHVAIAAPGVDVLVPAPEGGYQLTTGTSVAAAEISGVVALMLERNNKLTPNDVRAILSATAKKLPQGRNEVGAGLVDPVQALAKSGPKQAAR